MMKRNRSLPGFFSTIALLAMALSIADSAMAAPKVFSLALLTEPPQLNSMKQSDSESGFVLGHIMEGLTRYGKGGESLPGVAEKWDVTEKKITFHLRKNAKWSDGKGVTAKDFIFAWKTALEPSTASQYAFILYPIKNAEAINQGKMKSSALGATAPDDFTVVVELEKPCAYFVSMTAFPTYLPVREDFYALKKDRYAADVADLLSNGPFMLTKWVHGASLRMDKNPHYWAKDKIKLDAIDIPYITPDNNARFNFFKDKKTDILGLGRDELPKAQAEGFRMKSFTDGTVFYLEYNHHQGRPTANKNLRKAISSAYNLDEYVSRIVGIPGTKPARRFFPAWLRGVNKSFAEEFPMPPRKPDLAAARRYLEAAKAELGGRIPPLVLLTGDTPFSGRSAEYLQNLLRSTLGIEIKIDKQTFKQRLAKMQKGDFDIVEAGWGPDYLDPMTFADVYTSWNENNRGGWKNEKYDQLIRSAQQTGDQKKRMSAMAEAEKLLLEEEVIFPQYERTIVYVTSDRVTGIVRHQVGADPDLTGADVVK